MLLGIREAMTAIKRFSLKWKKTYPNAVNCLLKDEEDLLTFFNVQDPSIWTHIRTTFCQKKGNSSR